MNIQEKLTLKILAKPIFELFSLIFKSKRDPTENLALRQQLAVQLRKIKKINLKDPGISNPAGMEICSIR